MWIIFVIVDHNVAMLIQFFGLKPSIHLEKDE